MVAKKKPTGSFTDYAILVRLSRSIWGAHTKDAKASREAAKSNHASEDAVRAWISLAPRDALSGVRAAQRVCWAIWMKYTLPWLDDGKRILASELFSQFTKEMREAVDKTNEAADDFVKTVWPVVKKNAHKRLGDFLTRHPLPTAEQLRSKMRVIVSYDSVSNVNDFRAKGLSKEQLAEIRDEMKDSVQDALKVAIDSIWVDVRVMVKKIAEKTRSDGAIFRDTLIGNLKNKMKLLPSLNFTNDAKTEELRILCEENLTNVDPQDLRDDPVKRKKAYKAAKEVLKLIEEVIGPEPDETKPPRPSSLEEDIKEQQAMKDGIKKAKKKAKKKTSKRKVTKKKAKKEELTADDVMAKIDAERGQ